MKLLDLRLKHAGSIVASAIGEFTSVSKGDAGGSSRRDGPHQEIVCLRAGGTIDLYRIVVAVSSNNTDDDDDDDDEEVTTTLKLITRLETRSVLRSVSAVRVSGGKRDVVVVGSDSGCLAVIDFGEEGVGRVLHCPVFGKVGE